MSPAVSQVSRSTRTRLRILRRLAFLAVFLVVAMLVVGQFTELQRLATGVLASTALVVAVVGFAAQRTLANVMAGIQIAVAPPIRIGDRIEFQECEGRVTDITLSYTYLDPGDGSSIVIPNQLLTEGTVHNRSTADTIEEKAA
jgi:small conductance mechanosensitive channel